MLAMVLGSGECLWDDVEAFRALHTKPGIIVACNDAVAHWPDRLTAACSLHPDKIAGWLRARERAGFAEPDWAFADCASGAGFGYDETPYRFAGQTASGSSGLFALKVALEDLGATRAVLCGVPMDTRAHFHVGGPWGGARRHQIGWRQALPAIAGRARSMSGWTRDMLGGPTQSWMRNG